MTMWCWYIEGGGSFHDGYSTRMDAIRAAREEDADVVRLFIGTVTSPMEEAARIVDAHDLAQQLEERLNVDDCRMRVGAGAQEALRAWVLEHLEFDAYAVCLDGDKPTADEWREAAKALAILGGE